jgi:uncharacterized coiled-coil protein SlyX
MALWTEEMLDALADRMSQSSESAIRSQERLARSEEILASSEERLAATNDALAEGRVSLELTKKTVESNARSNEASSNAIAASSFETKELKKNLAQFIGIVGGVYPSNYFSSGYFRRSSVVFIPTGSTGID